MKRSVLVILIVAIVAIGITVVVSITKHNQVKQEEERQAILHMGDSLDAAIENVNVATSALSDLSDIEARRDMINTAFQNALTQAERQYWLDELRKLNEEIDQKYSDYLP